MSEVTKWATQGDVLSKRPLRIAMDIDGVLADFTYAFTLLARGLGENEEPAWGAREHKGGYGFDFNVYPVWQALERTPNWWLTLPSLMSELDVYRLNQAIKKESLVFITSRRETVLDGATTWMESSLNGGLTVLAQTRLWLKSMGVLVALTNVVMTGAAVKGEAAAAHGVTCALDDDPKAVLDLDGLGVDTWIMDRGYNRTVLPMANRVGSVAEFLEQVEARYAAGAYGQGEDISAGTPPHG